MPVIVEASFLSSLSSFFASDQAYAETDANTLTSPKVGDNNLQNMPILAANVSAASVIQDKNNKNGPKENMPDSTTISDTNIVSDNALAPTTGPLGVSDSRDIPDPSSYQTSVYVIRKGDSISGIADLFGVSVNTILWANNMKKGDKLTEGDVLFILPISGLKYTVKKGDTLQSIAKNYKADVSNIVQYNEIADNAKLAAGDELIIPNGQKSEENDKPIENLGASIAKDKQYYENHPVQNLAGYYIDPVPGYRKSQGVHDNNAVDLAIGKGTPIHAAADGRVIFARNGYNGGFGNLVIIDHPNGTETLYAHQSKLSTTTGAEVYQGQVIGYVGSTGRSTGPHLHFEVHGARNPGADGSWKY